jgi:hypothetical protein
VLGLISRKVRLEAYAPVSVLLKIHEVTWISDKNKNKNKNKKHQKVKWRCSPGSPDGLPKPEFRVAIVWVRICHIVNSCLVTSNIPKRVYPWISIQFAGKKINQETFDDSK